MKHPKSKKLIINDEAKIITLICCLLQTLGRLTESELLEILTVDDLVPQFKLIDALTTAEDKALVEISEKSYSVNSTGRDWLVQFESFIPVELRQKLIETGKDVIFLARLRKTANWGIAQEKNGNSYFYAHFLNEMDGSKIMEVKIHSKTETGAAKAQEKFLKNPVDILSNTLKYFI